MAYSDEELMAIANSPVQIPGNPATTISVRQNNPGNIKFSPNDPYSMGEGTKGFSIYRTPGEGLAALHDLIDRYYKPQNLTIAQMGEIYAPRFENNTDNWIKTVSQISGVKPNTPINQIPTPDLARAIVAIESSTRLPSPQQNMKLQPGPSDEELMNIAGKAQPQPKPLPGKVQSIPEMVGPALQEQVQPPESLESMVGGYIPQSIKDALSYGADKIGGILNYITPTMPQTGAIGGGLAGARLGAMTGNPFGPLAGGIIGAGLGYAGTGQAEKAIAAAQGEQMPPIPEQLIGVGKDIGKGALMQIGGESFGAAMSPFANRVAQRMAENAAVREAQNMVTQGVPISPSEISGSRLARFFEGLAERVWPASSRMVKYRNSLQDVAEGLKNEFVESKGLYNVSKKSVDEAWNNWVNLAGGPETLYPMPNTRIALNAAINQPFATGEFWTKHAKTFYDRLQFSEPGIINKTGEVPVQAVRDLFNTLRPGSAKGAERTAMMKIADAISTDLESVGGKEVSDALGTAREMTYLNRVATPLRNIFNSATIEPIKAGEDVFFSPAKFVKLWNERKPNFIDNPNFSDKDILVIDKFSDMMKAMTSDLAKGAKAPTGASSLIRLDLRNPAAVATAVYKQPLLALIPGGDWFLAGSLMNPKGYMRRFLTTGLQPPTLPVKIGIGKYLEEEK